MRRTAAPGLLVVLALLAALSACRDDGDAVDDEAVVEPSRIDVAPTAARLAVGSTLAASAVVYGADGKTLPSAGVTWSSSAQSVASVAPSGVITGLSAGDSTISAAAGKASSSMSLTVAPAVIINLGGRSNVLAPEESMRLVPSTLDENNLALTADLDWSSSDTTVLTVTSDGVVKAVAPGDASIRAATGNTWGNFPIAVQAAVHDRIAFVSKREPLPGTTNFSGGIYLMHADGSHVTLRVPDGNIFACGPDWMSEPACLLPSKQPALANDGLRLAGVVWRLYEIEYPEVTVITVCAIERSTCTVVDFPAQTYYGPSAILGSVQSPAWSPDGRRLAFSIQSGGIWVWDLEASTWQAIELRSTSNPEPAWSPDGSRIAVAIRVSNTESAIWTLKPDGSDRVCLCAGGENDSSPAWSPDGTRIAFVRSTGPDSEVFVMNVDGSGAANLTSHPSQDGRPSWSGDGARIAFETNRDGNWEIYVMNADGSQPINLTAHPADDRSPSWGR